MRRLSRTFMAELPGPVSEAYVDLLRALSEHGKIDAQLREMLRMKTAILADCKH